jgi:hypothetical protein
MLGGTVTVKLTPLLARPLTVTTTLPVLAPLGTVTVMLVAPHMEAVPALTPLKLTVLLPWLAPKLLPVMLTAVPTGPEAGFSALMLGGTVTVKLAPLLGIPPAVITTFPLVAPGGTAAMILVALQLVGVAAVPLNVTVLAPCASPKFAPVMVTDVPTGPETGFRPVMLGGTITVKLTPLLARPCTVTTTLPEVAPMGTGTTMLVSPQLDGAAGAPLNVSVLVPCVAPKFVPVIVMAVPTTAARPEIPLICGLWITVKFIPLPATPPIETMTLPVVASMGTRTSIAVSLQLIGIADFPLKVTSEPVLSVAPKFVPAIVTN